MTSVPQLRQTAIVVLGMTPNWSRLENSVIELGATILYAAIAESLINTVEVVLDSVEMKEEFLGIKRRKKSCTMTQMQT
jgi:hypothetical protein